MSARSTGVTVLAVVLILAGGLSAVGAMMSLTLGGRQLDRMVTLINQQLDRVPIGTGPGRAAKEQVDTIRQEVSERFVALRRLMESKRMRAAYLAQIALGLAACLGGIGLWRRRPWSSRLITWQAVLSVGFGVWWLLASPLAAFQREMIQFMFNLLERAAPLSTQMQMRQAIEMSQTAGRWGGLLWIGLWNGFLIWFVNRPSVKTGCVS